MNRIFIAGDSFVEGVGSTDKIGWAQCIKKQINHCPVEIDGKGGLTSEGLVEKVFKYNPMPFDTYIFQIGTNDSRYRPSLKKQEVDIKTFKINLLTIKNKLKITEKVRLFFVGLFFVDESMTMPYKEDKIYTDEMISLYNKTLKDVCEANDVSFIDLSEHEKCFDLLKDGLHPSDLGHSFIYDKVMDSIFNG